MLYIHAKGRYTVLSVEHEDNVENAFIYTCVDRIMLLLVCMAHYRKFIIKCNLVLWALREYSMCLYLVSSRTE